MRWICTDSQGSFILAASSVTNIKRVLLVELCNLYYVKTEKVVVSNLNLAASLEKITFDSDKVLNFQEQL